MGACLNKQAANVSGPFLICSSPQKPPWQVQKPSVSNIIFKKLPYDFSSHIICDWLSIETILKLDSACCNTTIRPLFLNAIRKQHVHRPVHRISAKNAQQVINWSLAREVLYQCTSMRVTYASSIFSDLYTTFSLMNDMVFSDDIVKMHLSIMMLSIISLSYYGKPIFTVEIICRVVNLLKHPDIHIVMSAVCIGANLLGSACREQQVVVSQHFLPAFLPLLSHRSCVIRENLCNVLVITVSVHKSEIPAFIEAGIVAKYITYLKDPKVALKTRALELLSSVVIAHNMLYTRYLFGQGAVPLVCALIRGDNTELARDAMHLASSFLREAKRNNELYEQVLKQMIRSGVAGTIDRLSSTNVTASSIQHALKL